MYVISVGIISKLFSLELITSYLLGVLFSLYVNHTVMMSLMWMCRWYVSYVFIYLSVGIFSKLFNLVFITSYLAPVTYNQVQPFRICYLASFKPYT